MTTTRRVGVLVLLLGLGLFLAGGASAHHGSSGDKHWAPRERTYPFLIRGDVANLYPGSTKHYTVTITNKNSFAIVVTDISVRVDQASRRCTKQNVSSPGFHGFIVVPAHRSTPVTLPITMSPKAPDACQGATFSLTYSGSGRRL